MREGRRGGMETMNTRREINPRRTAAGHIPDEFRPIEEVEAEESLRGPGRHVNLNEIPESIEGESGEYLTVEDRMAAELDKTREQERLDALEENDDELLEEDIDALANESYEDSAEGGGGPIVLDAPTKKISRYKDIKIVRADEFFRKGQRYVTGKEFKGKHPEQKPKYKEIKPKGNITRY